MIAVFEPILSAQLGTAVKIERLKNLSGGCINNALKAETSQGNFFIKFNEKSPLPLFETEANGLKRLKKASVIDIPEVISYGNYEHGIYLILQYIEKGPQKADYWKNFGASLAHLHHHSAGQYGLEFDNYIGSLPQSNRQASDWIQFFLEERLNPQLELALQSGRVNKDLSDSFAVLYKKLPKLLIQEKPALLHGDLWSGNVMVNSNGYATLIDPAVYFGHREIELAFTQLFGGFDPEFYRSYMEAFPLEKGYQERFDIYNLYPLLVHVNLFGGGYINSVRSILKKNL